MNKIIDTVLGLQQRDGLFSPRMGGDGCADYDAVDTLVKFWHTSDYRKKQITGCLERTYEALCCVRHPSGGFLWNAPNSIQWTDWIRHGLSLKHPFNWYYINRQLMAAKLRRGRPRFPRGWTRKGISCDEPDLFATFTRIMTIYLIAEVLDIPERGMRRRFLKTPGLGWHFQEVSVVS